MAARTVIPMAEPSAILKALMMADKSEFEMVETRVYERVYW